MPSPKSGSAGSAVPPAPPDPASDADDANPGAVEAIQGTQLKTKTGKYGSVQVQPYKPPQTKADKDKKKSWIEIVLVDEDDNPQAGEEYQITLPDGSVADGTLDEKGFARVDGIDSGTCDVTFPNLDKDAWKKLS